MHDNDIENEISSAIKERRALEYKTKLDKTKFIVEMKNGLGETIMLDPLRVTFIRKPWHVRFGNGLRNIITKIFTRF